MRRLSTCFATLAIVAFLTVAAPTRADEGSDAPVRMRILSVEFLTQGRLDHVRAFPPASAGVFYYDEERPLFGCEAEEPLLPFGTVDEIIELVYNAVRPEYWDSRRDVGIRARGEHDLVVRAAADVQADVARFVRRLEDFAKPMVTVEVQAVRLTRAQVATFDPRAEGPPSGPTGPAVSVTAFCGLQATAFGGSQRAWLVDQHTEVATGSQVSDPVVQVGNLGLYFSVRSTPVSGQRRILVELHASLAELAGGRTVDTGATGTVEAATHSLLTTRSSVVVPNREWVLLDGRGAEGKDAGWYLAVRATLVDPPPAARPVPALELPTLPPPPLRPDGRRDREAYDIRYFPIPALTASPRHVPGEGTHLTPSNYVHPESSELPEPSPVMAGEYLLELLRDSAPERTWYDPASIEVRNQTLIARNGKDVLDAVDVWLAALRAHYLRTLHVNAQLLETDVVTGRALATGRPLSDLQWGLLKAGLASGEIRRLSVANVTSIGGARNTTVAGRRVSYVFDYDAEVAERAWILNPSVAMYLDGAEVDVDPALASDGLTAQVAVRYVHARPVGPHRVAAVHGGATLELPELALQEVRTELAVPLDAHVVVASWGAGDHVRLLLIQAEMR